MTESEWNACANPEPMLTFLRAHNSGRKRRLFAVACCRRVEQWMPPDSRTAVEVAERYADGLASESEREAAWMAAGPVQDEAPSYAAMQAAYCAYRVAERAEDYDRPACWDEDVAAWVAQVAAQAGAWTGSAWDEPMLTAARAALASLLRDVFGPLPFRRVALDPSWLAWDGGTVVRLAREIYERRAFEQTAVLADALEDAGCTNAEVLGHLRGPGPHVRGCWAVDLCLGKS
jgi:hypothetical protein